MQNNYKQFFYKALIVVVLGITAYLIFLIKSFILTLFFAFLLAVLFSPFLNFFNRFRIHDGIGIIIIYLIIISFLILVFFSVLPIFIKQSNILIEIISGKINYRQNLYENQWISWLPIPDFIKNYLWGFINNIDFSTLFDYLKNNFSNISKFFTNNIRNITFSSLGFFASVAWWIFSLIMIIIFNFFIVLDRKNIKKFFYNIIPQKASSYIQKREKDIVFCFSKWLQGQVILSISMFILTFIGLYIISFFWINIENKIWLSLIVWLMEFIPYIWPILAFIPALAITITMWLNAVIIVIILYFGIQQIEGNFLVPVVMWKTLDLSPFFVLFMMTLWWSLYGIIWIILALPFAAVIQIFVKDYIDYKNNTSPKTSKIQKVSNSNQKKQITSYEKKWKD